MFNKSTYVNMDPPLLSHIEPLIPVLPRFVHQLCQVTGWDASNFKAGSMSFFAHSENHIQALIWICFNTHCIYIYIMYIIVYIYIIYIHLQAKIYVYIYIYIIYIYAMQVAATQKKPGKFQPRQRRGHSHGRIATLGIPRRGIGAMVIFMGFRWDLMVILMGF